MYNLKGVCYNVKTYCELEKFLIKLPWPKKLIGYDQSEKMLMYVKLSVVIVYQGGRWVKIQFWL